MAGLSRYETCALGLTAAFALLTGGFFLARRSAPVPYQVQVSQSAPASSSQEAVREHPGSGEDTYPETLLEGEVIDLNAADVYDLQRLPGIGEKRAQAIAAYREEHGPFRSVDELVNVPGIGEGILAGLREYATAESAVNQTGN